MAFEIQLTAALIEQICKGEVVKRRYVVTIVSKGTLLNLIVQADSLTGISIATALDSLYIEQIGICQAIEHIVGRGKRLVIEHLAVFLLIGPLDTGIALVVIRPRGNLRRAVSTLIGGPEQGTLVALLEALHKILTSTHTSPLCIGESENILTTQARATTGCDEILCTAVGLCVIHIINDGEDNLRRLVVIIAEIVLIVGCQSVSASIDDVTQHGNGIIIMIALAIHLCIDIEIGENHLGHILVHLAIVGRALGGQGVQNIFQLALHE